MSYYGAYLYGTLLARTAPAGEARLARLIVSVDLKVDQIMALVSRLSHLASSSSQANDSYVFFN